MSIDISSYDNSCAGGLVGANSGTIEDCTASGKSISATNERGAAYTGGFIGYADDSGTLTDNHNETGVLPAIGNRPDMDI